MMNLEGLEPDAYNELKQCLEFFGWEISVVSDGERRGFDVRPAINPRCLGHAGCPGMDLFDEVGSLFDSVTPDDFVRISKDGGYQYLTSKDNDFNRVFLMLSIAIVNRAIEVKELCTPTGKRTQMIPESLVKKYTEIRKDLKERGHFDGTVLFYPSGEDASTLSLFFNGDSRVPLHLHNCLLQPFYRYEIMSGSEWGTKGLPTLPVEPDNFDILENTKEDIPYQYEIKIREFSGHTGYTPLMALWLVADFFTAIIGIYHEEGIEDLDW